MSKKKAERKIEEGDSTVRLISVRRKKEGLDAIVSRRDDTCEIAFQPLQSLSVLEVSRLQSLANSWSALGDADLTRHDFLNTVLHILRDTVLDAPVGEQTESLEALFADYYSKPILSLRQDSSNRFQSSRRQQLLALAGRCWFRQR